MSKKAHNPVAGAGGQGTQLQGKGTCGQSPGGSSRSRRDPFGAQARTTAHARCPSSLGSAWHWLPPSLQAAFC